MTLSAAPVIDTADLVRIVEGLEPERGIYLGGVHRAAQDAATFPVIDPATGDVIAHVADGSDADAAAAVDAAAAAFPDWAATGPRRRSEVLHTAFELMLDEIDQFAALIAWENGKALPDARAEVAYAAEFFRWLAEEAVRPASEFREAPAGGTRTLVTSRPVGVAALITPWNFPAAMGTRKIGPALAAGCSVVVKPASATPLTTLAVAGVLTRAGVPDGVVNVVPTSRAGKVVSAWLSDSRVRKVSFTGSTEVGKKLLTQAAERIVNSSMELGGNAAFVVAADADIRAAVAGAMVAKFRNGGQACTAANRFYVHGDIAAQFIARFGAAIEALKVGGAFEENTAVGPVIDQHAVSTISHLVQDAVAAGAKITHRALAPTGQGTFYPPTLLNDVPPDAAILREEVFGPVAPVVTWNDDRELLNHINASEFGLAAYVYSRNLKWAMQLAEHIDAGMVGINRGLISDPSAPFGGVKESGIGREGAHGVRDYCETQYFSIDWSQETSA